MDRIPDSATIMLIPDAVYRAARPRTKDHHLTVAHFGKASDLTTSGTARLLNTVRTLARFQGPISAIANGLGMFDAGRDGLAVVDLIDAPELNVLWSQVHNLFGGPAGIDGVAMSLKHGFTPHITREYLNREDDYYGEVTPDQIDNHPIVFETIGLWYGPNRYEVQL